MKRVVKIALLVVLLSSCGSPATPTVEMIINLATWTPEAPKAATATDEPTFTPIPPTFTLTATTAPKKIADRAQLIAAMAGIIKNAGVENVQIVDARYTDGGNGARTVFHLEARYTATPFDDRTPANLIGVLAGFVAGNPALPPELTDFNIVVRDAKGNPAQSVEGQWKDLVDFSADRITADQLVARLSLIVQATPTRTRVATKVLTAGPTRTARPTAIPTVFLPTNTPVVVIVPPTNTPEVIVIPPTNPPAQACCKVCSAGKACGDSCISKDKTCNKGPGCACDG